MTTATVAAWYKTPDAAKALGVCESTLKKSYAAPEEKGGFLVEGVHFRRGPRQNSPIGWNIEACRQAMEERGILHYAKPS